MKTMTKPPSETEWQVYSLREAGVSLIDCEHRTPPAACDGYPYVAIPQIKNGRLDLSDARNISSDHYVEWTRKAKPQGYDIILSRRCNPGETALVPPGLECALGQNLVILRADGTRIFPPFLRWLVRGQEWWEQIGTYLNVGAIFDSLKCADIPNFRLTIPPLHEQKRIADILGALDDKIELNRRMNETLEAMARALFQSWFIDFDPVHAKAAGRKPDGLDAATAKMFPSEFEDSEFGKIPKGWRVAKLKDMTSKIGSGATPRGGSAVYVEEGTALIRSQNVHDHDFRWDGLVRLTDKSASELSGVEVRSGDVLFNITGDSILRTCVVDPAVLPARVNQHVAIIRASGGIPSRYIHLCLVQSQMKAFLAGLNTGATRQAVTKGHLENIGLPLPSPEVLCAFDQATAAMFCDIETNRNQIRVLAATRDELLSPLLSGEFSVTAEVT